MSQIYKSSSGGGSGPVNSVTGIGNIVASPTTGNVVVSSNGIQLIRGPIVDLTVAGPTLLFTTGPSTFAILYITLLTSSIAGQMSISIFNIGWTPPNYDDFVMGTSSTFTQNNEYYNLFFATTPGVMIPAATNVYINVTTPAVATTDLEAVYITGFYL